MPQNLLDLTRPQLHEYFAQMGESRYRVEQVMKWVYHRGANDFAAMSDISKALRTKLSADFLIGIPNVVSFERAQDGTRKWVVESALSETANQVESVLIPDKGRTTLCVSSQVGCMLDCSFCATGKQGFAGNLSTGDIIGQVLIAQRLLAAEGDERGVTNVVMMGMGEPLLNFEAVLAATDLMRDTMAFGISKRRVTISTAGVVPAIYELAERTDVSLAVSLHAPTDDLRDQLVPINRKYPIAELLAACKYYQDEKFGEGRSITFEYTLLKGVNDSPLHARQLIRLLSSFPCKINLIPFNPFWGSEYARPDDQSVRDFQTILMNAGFATMLRTTRGDDIAAACGQLVGKVVDRTRRSERHKQRVAARQEAAIEPTTPMPIRWATEQVST